MKKRFAAEIAAAATVFLYWSDKALTTTACTFADPRVPEAFDGARIVQVSDLQSTWFGTEQKDLLHAVARCQPDYIVVTGDLMDRNHTDEMAAMTAVEGLAAIAPVYYCNGNHELALPPAYTSQMYDSMEALGVNVLLDGKSVVEKDGDRLHWIGLSEETVYLAKEAASVAEHGDGTQFEPRRTDTAYDASVVSDVIANLTADIPEGAFTIMLAHEPQFLETYADAGKGKIDLIFSGHAHGGQIRLPFTEGLFAPGQGILPKLTSGMHISGETTMVISRGLGNSVFPFRVFNRPEVVVCELRKE